VLDLLKAVVLGLIQGLTEFLPISSSAHLRIFPELFGWGDPGAAFTAVVQIGTELAVLIYFRHDIWRIGSTWVRSLVQPEWRGHVDARLGWYIIIGSLPIVVLGIALKDVIEQDFRSLWIIGSTLIVLGLVLGIADKFGRNDRAIKKMGRFLGFERAAATRFAFLLAIPAVVGAGLFQLSEIPGGDNAYGWGPTLVGTIVSFIVGYAAIAWLLRYVSTNSYTPFVVYRVLLGGTVLVLLGTGVLTA